MAAGRAAPGRARLIGRVAVDEIEVLVIDIEVDQFDDIIGDEHGIEHESREERHRMRHGCAYRDARNGLGHFIELAAQLLLDPSQHEALEQFERRPTLGRASGG